MLRWALLSLAVSTMTALVGFGRFFDLRFELAKTLSCVFVLIATSLVLLWALSRGGSRLI